MTALFYIVQADASDTKPRVAVLLFVPQNMEATSLMETIPTVLTSAFNRTNYFKIVERRIVDKEILLKGYQISSLKNEELSKIGGALGLDFIIYGDVKKGAGIVTVTINVLDIKVQTPCYQNTLAVSEGVLNDKLIEICNVITTRTIECFNHIASVKKEKEYVEVPYDLKVSQEDKKISLAWKYNSIQHISGFKIYRATGKHETYMMIGAVPGLSFVDSNPPVTESVYYKITAVYINGMEGRPSDIVDVRLAGEQMPPIFLNIIPDIKSAHLKWRAYPKSSGSGFKIYRKTAEEEFREIASVSDDNSKYTDKGLNDDTLYNYALSSVDSKGITGGLSAILKTTTIKAPDGVTAEGGKIRQILISWNALSSDDVKGYHIYRSADKTSGYKQIADINDRKSNNYFDKKDLGDLAEYWYRITGYNSEDMDTDMSNAVSAVTRGKPPVPQGPAAKDREPRKASIRWEIVNSPDDEIMGYAVFRSTEENGKYEKIAGIHKPEEGSFIDMEPPLKDNTLYYYRISSYNSAGVYSNMSIPVSSTTKALPGIPTGLSAKSGEVKQITLAWNPNSEEDITGYNVYRGKSEDNFFEKLAFVKGRTDYIDAGLKDGDSYFYSIDAVDKDNLKSGLSSPVTAVSKLLPVKPSGLRISNKDGRKILLWDANPEKDIKEYNIYKKGFLGISLKVAAVQGNSWIIEGIRGGAEIFLRALDETGLESNVSDLFFIEGIK